MHFYDPRQHTLLTVDASPTGLGAILSNVDDQGNTRNVAYVVGRYSQTEREALACSSVGLRTLSLPSQEAYIEVPSRNMISIYGIYQKSLSF